MDVCGGIKTTHWLSADPRGPGLRLSHSQDESRLDRSAVISMLEIPENNIYSPLEG